ncbi:30S ribosomal protein S6 [Candidatus Marinamargulisbacteria bacterium SCGC AG-439-L15]|nr:30S ribosomal protein S6 [Candidatus Marinamargulisbacteria bacterium SCGC AG-439-L15]
MANGYEVIIIIKANLGEDNIQQLSTQFEELVKKNEGTILSLENIGKRELATPIKHETHGVFIQCQLTANNKTLSEMKNFFKVTETIMRHLIINLEDILPQAELEAKLKASA